MNPGFYHASWGMDIKAITYVATALVLIILVHFALHLDPGWWALAVAALLLVNFRAWALSVRGYTIEGDSLVIHRLFGETRLPLAGLQNAEADPQALKGALRLFGVDGPFGFYGRFWTRKLGRFRVWATNRNNLVVLRFARQTWVLSPDHPEDFVRQIHPDAARA